MKVMLWKTYKEMERFCFLIAISRQKILTLGRVVMVMMMPA
jgi:hypothetical protein